MASALELPVRAGGASKAAILRRGFVRIAVAAHAGESVDEELEALAGLGLEERAVVDLAEPLVHLRQLAREDLREGARDAAGGEALELGVLGEPGFDQGCGAARAWSVALGKVLQGRGHLRIIRHLAF